METIETLSVDWLLEKILEKDFRRQNGVVLKWVDHFVFDLDKTYSAVEDKCWWSGKRVDCGLPLKTRLMEEKVIKAESGGE